MNGPPQEDTPPYGIIAQQLRAGQVVPFLGAGASAVYRPEGEEGWDSGKDFLPFASELAQKLARDATYPEDPDAVSDLALVASYYEHVEGDRPSLNLALRQALTGAHRPGTIHALLARIEEPLLIVTTTYDDLIEQAFSERGYYLVVDRGERSRVWVAGNGGDGGLEAVKINDLRKALLPEDRTIIYKLHGTLDREREEHDSFLITEQDYVDVLGRTSYVPPYLATRMAQASFLFLGYSLADWNIRVMLRKLRLAKKQDEELRCWAIHRNPGPVARKIWGAHKVNMYNFDLKVFVRELAQRLGLDPDEPAG